MKKMTKNDRIKMCNDFISKYPNHGIFRKYFRTHMLTELPNGVPFELKFVRAIDIYFTEQGATKRYITKELTKLGDKDCSKKAEQLIEECISCNTEFVDDEIAVELSCCNNERDLIEEICNLVADVEYILFKFKERYLTNAQKENNDENDNNNWWKTSDEDDDDDDLFDWDSLFDDDNEDDDEETEPHKDDKKDENGDELSDFIAKLRGDNTEVKGDDTHDDTNNKVNIDSRTADDFISTERLKYLKDLTDVIKCKIQRSEDEKDEKSKDEIKLCNVIVEKFEMSPRLTAFAIGQYTQTPREQLEAKLEKLPLTVAENIPADKANELVSNLSNVKISAKIEYK